MELSEHARWLLLGFVSQEELEKEWRYHSSANYELLMKFIGGAAQYGVADSDKEIEFLEARLPLVFFRRDNNIVDPDVKFVLEFYKEGFGLLRSNVLDIDPGEDFALRLQKQLIVVKYFVFDSSL